MHGTGHYREWLVQARGCLGKQQRSLRWRNDLYIVRREIIYIYISYCSSSQWLCIYHAADSSRVQQKSCLLTQQVKKVIVAEIAATQEMKKQSFWILCYTCRISSCLTWPDILSLYWRATNERIITRALLFALCLPVLYYIVIVGIKLLIAE